MFSFKPNKKYTLIALYVGATIAAAVLLGVLLFNLPTVGGWISAFFTALSPLFYGLVIAYLTRPLVARFERLLHKLFRTEKKETDAARERTTQWVRSLAILVSFLLLAAIVFCFTFFVIPLLIGDSRELVGRLGSLASTIASIINTLGSTFGFDLAVSVDYLFEILASSRDVIIDAIVSFGSSLATAVFDILIGVCLSVGILYHRATLSALLRRLGAAFCSERVYRYLERVIFYSNRVFGKYLIGKIVECTIVGLIYLIILPILGVPYPVLITVVMTITNFVPIIGAFLGGIPCGILILLGDNPILALWFAILVLAVEQIDGNIIFPKVIGTIIDLRGVWIMVAVALFGGFFGVVGMFLSPPLFSIIYMIIRDATNHRLEKKGQATDTEGYSDRFAATAPPRKRKFKYHFFFGETEHEETDASHKETKKSPTSDQPPTDDGQSNEK